MQFFLWMFLKMGSFILDLIQSPGITLCNVFFAGILCLILYLIIYIIYYRFFHPLAKYPGPFLASITDLWQVAEFLSLKQPYNLTALHEKYGQFVRYGPDKLSTTAEDSIPILYQKGGSRFPKTEFYDAYGAAHPNVFGIRDVALHSIRRRHMSHSFSISSVKKMECYLDDNIAILKRKIADYCDRDEPFDLGKLLHYYVIDVLGELAFSQSFGVQIADDESLVPPVVEHSLLAAATGAWPAMTFRLKRWLPLLPSKTLRKLFEGRAACAALAASCVRRRVAALRDNEDNKSAMADQRSDILTSLILAKHPDTKERLTQADLETEAFGFIIAGTHTTSATTSLLFHHLLHAPDIMERCVAEIETQLPPLGEERPAYSVTEVEASLPYLRQCIKENFRITPVFTMPLARRIVAPEGVVIDGAHIPQGTSVAEPQSLRILQGKLTYAQLVRRVKDLETQLNCATAESAYDPSPASTDPASIIEETPVDALATNASELQSRSLSDTVVSICVPITADRPITLHFCEFVRGGRHLPGPGILFSFTKINERDRETP
ncbi:uncharacterized protein N0V89_010583 [Didymosphaeria variabile]|uniref:Cytochrome P450 n=1 Tax=Didymosphaeria variabile TaxID=1932322 RepID=A0A9W8XD70_9PLEO|nr:uncharacterized protein N0V89_010583 [Didymosphaeria variabile]KAJ4346652.1 hypothetical protein N0V89_010583 [Didymosphaeria variabile]